MSNKFGFTKDIKLVVSDFDGIFTDGGLYISEDMKTSKKISFKDIMGLSNLLKAGIEIVFISGEKTSAINYLIQKFPKLEAYQGIRDKFNVLEEVLTKKNINKNEVVFLGDDINDIKCLEYVNHALSVPNANQKVLNLKNIKITKNNGGDGAFREVADELIDL